MEIDKRIKAELENEAAEIDAILSEKQGLFNLVLSSYKNGLGRWMAMVTVIIFIVSGFMIWLGYRFTTATTIDDRLFWGVWFIISICLQIGFKHWTWMETNRVSILREVKRLEVAIARLAAKNN